MAVGLKELGSKLSYQEVNDILKLHPSPTPPPMDKDFDGQIWLDTSGEIPLLKRHIADEGGGPGTWKTIGEVTAEDVLALLKTVDGSDSGLDADMIDGIHGSSILRKDIPQAVGADTTWTDGSYVKFGADGDGAIRHTGALFSLTNNTGEMYVDQLNNGGNIHFRANNAGGTLKSMLVLDPDAGTATIDGNTIRHTGNDGPGSGMDADTVDGIQGASIMRNDTAQTVTANITMNDNVYLKFGNSGDTSIRHTGTLFNLINDTGDMYIDQRSNGSNIYLRANNAGGEVKNMLVLDPDALQATINGNVVWHAGNDGGGSGMDADKLDGIEASQFIRNDAAGDVNANIKWADGKVIYMGDDYDFGMYHNGTHAYFRSYNHGGNIYFQAENASGTNKTMITIDPDANRVTANINRASLVDLWCDNHTNDNTYPFIQTGRNSMPPRGYTDTVTFDQPFTSVPKVFFFVWASSTPVVELVVTTTGMTFGTNAVSGYINVDWLAIGRKV